MNDRFDFEQQFLKCWNVTGDLREVAEYFLDHHDSNFTKDRVSNTLIGYAEMYDIKFNKLWNIFESVHMELVRENKMLNEECAAMREQLGHSKNAVERIVKDW
jgi:hypothetical protein